MLSAPARPSTGRLASHGIVWGMVFVLMFLIGPAEARAEGVKWEDLTLDEALAKAEKKDTYVIVDLWAEHCGACGDMDEQLWNTEEGETLVDGLIAVKIATDKPEGATIQSRYPIMGLPMILFLRPDGTEIDRVVGYRNHKKVVEDATLIKSGIDLLPEMEAELGESTNLDLMGDILRKYLYRKRELDAEVLLEQIIAADKSGRAATSALTYTGKYYAYYARKAVRAQEYYVRLLKTYPHSNGVTSALKETLAYATKLGRTDEWIEFICGLTDANPGASRLNYYVARFAVRDGLRGECLARAARSAAKSDIPRAFEMDSLAVILEGP